MRAGLPTLARGDRVWVVAPAGPVPPVRLQAGLQRLADLGLAPEPAPHVGAAAGFLAGSDAVRAGDLAAAFASSDGRGVFYARGGYGTTRLLPALDLEALAASGKLLLGFSDTTALGLALSCRRPFPYLHGPTVADLGGPAADHDAASLKAGLFGLHPSGRQQVQGLSMLRPGRAEGVVLGGCLSLVAALLGTPYEAPLAGRILFLEDVNEEPYRLDRMLTQLLSGGRLEGLAGLLLGQFHRCLPRQGTTGSQTAEEVLEDLAQRLRCPVLAGLPAGHGPGRITIPLGMPAELDADAGTVIFHHR
jgi:muramoyltetrapeptide carboxypeptidase